MFTMDLTHVCVTVCFFESHCLCTLEHCLDYIVSFSTGIGPQPVTLQKLFQIQSCSHGVSLVVVPIFVILYIQCSFMVTSHFLPILI